MLYSTLRRLIVANEIGRDMSLQAGVMQPEETRAMLCISGVRQNLRLLSRIVTDLDYQLDEHICSEAETLPAADKCYRIVFATTDVPVHALETLRASPCVAGAKFVLIGGHASTDKISLELRQIFKFALFVQRPIKSSLLFVELQLLLDGEQLDGEQLNEAITAVEESELKFTDKLKANYIGVLAQRIEALNQALILFTNKEQADNEVERLEAERLAHNMRGTASSFGLAALARTASDMEQNSVLVRLFKIISRTCSTKLKKKRKCSHNDMLPSPRTTKMLLQE
jgi:hypothetical protein